MKPVEHFLLLFYLLLLDSWTTICKGHVFHLWKIYTKCRNVLNRHHQPLCSENRNGSTVTQLYTLSGNHYANTYTLFNEWSSHKHTTPFTSVTTCYHVPMAGSCSGIMQVCVCVCVCVCGWVSVCACVCVPCYWKDWMHVAHYNAAMIIITWLAGPGITQLRRKAYC